MRSLVMLALAWGLVVPGLCRAQEVDPGNTVSPGGEVESPAPVVVPPRLKQFVNAAYPQAASKGGIEGSVGLLVVVDETGKVGEVTVQQPAGNGFDEAAVEAVKAFQFEPATMDGQPIPVRIGYTYHFKIEKKEVKKEPGQVVDGAVKEKGVGLPVVGAEVALVEAKVRVTTDGKGRFKLRNIEPGTYRVVVSSPEYKPLEAEVVVEREKDVEVRLLVEPLIENPYETVVTGKKEEAVVTRYVLEQKTLETVPGTFGDPVRVVETLPGVARSPYGVGILVIRGAMPGDSKVFVEGIDIPLLYHFFGGPSVINPNFIDSIAYYPGNFPSKYGNAIAGIVDVVPKTDKVEAWSGELDINMINTSGFMEGKIGDKGSFRLGARRSYVDLVLLGALKVSGEDSVVVAPVFYDFQAQGSYDVTDRDRVGVFYMGSYDSMRLVATDEEEGQDIDLSTETDFHRVMPSWRHVGEKWSSVLHAYYGNDAFRFNAAGMEMDVAINIFGGRGDLEVRPVDWFTLGAGLAGGVGIGKFTGRVPMPPDYYIPGSSTAGLYMLRSETVSELKIDETYGVVGGYLEPKIMPFKGVTLVPGLHLAWWHHPDLDMYIWDPRFVARYSPIDSLTIKGGVGRYSMPPDPQYTDARYGNPNLEYQWAMHYSGGVEWEFYEGMSVDLLGFYVRRYDLAVPSADLVVGDDGTVKALNSESTGSGRSYGMEVMLKHNPTKRFYAWIAYTLSRTKVAGFGDVGAFAKPQTENGKDEDYILGPFDQTHILSAVASVVLGRGWETGLRIRFVSGNPDDPVLGGTFLGDSGSYAPIVGPYRSSRLPPFFQIDLRVEKKWTFDTWILSTYLDIQNVTNNANTEFISWDYRFKESWNVPGIPFFPSFGINGRF
jgi:TonB family protein